MKNLSVKVLLSSIAVGCIGVLCTYYLSLRIKSELEVQRYIKLQAIAEQVSVRLQDSIDIAVNDLRALQAYYLTGEQITLEKFYFFTQQLLTNSGGHIHALEWIPRIDAERRVKFEAELQKYYPGFSIFERNTSGELVLSAQKSFYYPVTYINPYESNRAAHGFDLNSSSIRRASLIFSRDTNALATTARIQLVQEKFESFGFLIFAPIHRSVRLNDRDIPKNKIQETINDVFIGFVLGVFRVDELIANPLLQAKREKLAFTLLDITEGDGGVLYGEQRDGVAFSFDLSIPNRQWQLQISLNEELKTAIDSPPLVDGVMFGGGLVSILLALCTFFLQRISLGARQIHILNKQILAHNLGLEDTVTERTESLAQKNKELNSHVDELTKQRKVQSILMDDAKRAKDDAEQWASELARSNRDLDDFAYVASHDLKSPLRGIDQLASWVIEDLSEGNTKEISKNLLLMRKRVQRLETLLDDLLAYSRVSRQEQVLVQMNCRLVIEDMFFLNSPPADFRLKIEGELPIFTTVITPFEQIIRNLLSNAIKHHNRNDGVIKVSCNDEGGYYKFSIHDDGLGIDAQFHEQIFKMFKTLKPRDETEGSGMGLALIKKIVEYYNGEVSLESTLGKGTTFYFTWPKKL